MMAMCMTFFLARMNNASVIPPTALGRKVIIFRSLAGAPLFLMFIYSSMALPSQIFTVLINMNIAYSVILGPCLSNEWPTIKSGLSVLVSLFGVILITDPALVGIGDGEQIESSYPKIALVTVTICAVGTVLMSVILSKWSKFFVVLLANFI